MKKNKVNTDGVVTRKAKIFKPQLEKLNHKDKVSNFISHLQSSLGVNPELVEQ